MSAREFWHMSPRKLLMLIKQKKKKDIEQMKILAYLVQGGELEEEEEDEGGIIGVDIPAPSGALDWMTKGGAVYGG